MAYTSKMYSITYTRSLYILNALVEDYHMVNVHTIMQCKFIGELGILYWMG